MIDEINLILYHTIVIILILAFKNYLWKENSYS